MLTCTLSMNARLLTLKPPVLRTSALSQKPRDASGIYRPDATHSNLEQPRFPVILPVIIVSHEKLVDHPVVTNLLITSKIQPQLSKPLNSGTFKLGTTAMLRLVFLC